MAARARKVVLEIQNVLDVRAAPAINRLIFVAHHADIAVRFRQQPHQLVLAAVGVLILVDHHVAEPPVIQRAGGFIVIEQAHGLQQQIVEIERVGRVQRLFVFVPDDGQLARRRIFRVAIEILRRLLHDSWPG
jgi:hypothetical protein